MKLWKMKLLLILLLVSSSVAASEPGARPDVSPGTIGGWWNPLEQRILDSIESIPDTDAEIAAQAKSLDEKHREKIAELTQKRNEAGKFTLISRSKSDWTEEIQKAERKYNQERSRIVNAVIAEHKQKTDNLYNLLASSGGNQDLIQARAQTTPFSARHETLEVKAALQNLKSTTHYQVEKLKSAGTDYALAEDTYQKLESLFSYVLDMNATLLARIQSHYIPSVERNTAALKDHQRQVKKDSQFSFRDAELQRIKKIKANNKAFRDHLSKLDIELRERSNALSRGKTDIQHLLRGVRIAESIQSSAQEIIALVDDISIALPEIPEYDTEPLNL